MSMIKNSAACSKSELDLFYTLPTNTSIIRSNITSFVVPPLDGSEDTFSIEIPGTEEYTDLNDIFLEIDVKIQDIKTTTICSPINNFGHSLFRNIELSIGTGLKTVMIESGNYYAYKAYLLNLLNFSEDIKNTSLKLGIWEKDIAKKFDNKENTGFLERKKSFSNKNETSKLIFPLHLDFLNSNRFLLCKYGMTFTFKRNDNKFVLMGDEFNKCTVKIMKAKILARRCYINPAVISAHHHAMLSTPAKYPIKQNRIYVAHISEGVSDFTPPSFLSTIPNKIVIGLVLDSSFFGDSFNPYNFQHFDVSKLTLAIDSQEQYLKMDTKNDDCSEAYHSIFQSLNLYNQGSNGITKDDFIGGNCLYCFNLNPDKGCEEQFNAVRTGSLVIKVEFNTPTTNKIRMICLMEFDNQINIDNQSEVYYDYVLN